MVRYPSLYQINTRVWLREFSKRLGRPATLSDIPDEFLDEIVPWGSTISGSWASGRPDRPDERSP